MFYWYNPMKYEFNPFALISQFEMYREQLKDTWDWITEKMIDWLIDWFCKIECNWILWNILYLIILGKPGKYDLKCFREYVWDMISNTAMHSCADLRILVDFNYLLNETSDIQTGFILSNLTSTLSGLNSFTTPRRPKILCNCYYLHWPFLILWSNI